MAEKTITTKGFDEIMNLLRHLGGELVADRLLRGQSFSKDDSGKIKYKPLSSDDNALLARLISRAVAKVTSATLTAEEEIKFFQLLSATADKFKMITNSPLKVWPAFIDNLITADQQPVNLLKQKLVEQHGWQDPSPDQKYQLSEELKRTIITPFIRSLLNMEAEQAKLVIKDFCDLPDQEAKLTMFRPYLALAKVQNNSPAVIIPAFFRFLYEQADKDAKSKLQKRAAAGLKHLARHLGGILQQESAAIQWLGVPFIELMKCLAVQSQDDAELFLISFCNLPDHQARLEFYRTIIAQPEHPVDIAIRILDNIINKVKDTRNKWEKSFDDAANPGGWRDKNKRFSQKADQFNRNSKLFY
jgi:hypothetical protein